MSPPLYFYREDGILRKDKSSKIEPRGDVCNTPKYALSCLMPYVPTEWLVNVEAFTKTYNW